MEDFLFKTPKKVKLYPGIQLSTIPQRIQKSPIIKIETTPKNKE